MIPHLPQAMFEKCFIKAPIEYFWIKWHVTQQDNHLKCLIKPESLLCPRQSLGTLGAIRLSGSFCGGNRFADRVALRLLTLHQTRIQLIAVTDRSDSDIGEDRPVRNQAAHNTAVFIESQYPNETWD